MRDSRTPSRRGAVSVYSCPDCGGALWQLDCEEAVEFHCPVGHRWEAVRLLAAKSRASEHALMEAVRGFKETGLLLRQLAVMLNTRDDRADLELAALANRRLSLALLTLARGGSK